MHIRVYLIGFDGKKRSLNIEYLGYESIRDIIAKVKSMINIRFDDEIMIICNNKQLYLDDLIPNECNELELYPLAHGG